MSKKFFLIEVMIFVKNEYFFSHIFLNELASGALIKGIIVIANNKHMDLYYICYS